MRTRPVLLALAFALPAGCFALGGARAAPAPLHLCALLSPAVVAPLFAPLADGRTLEKPLERFDGGGCTYRIVTPRVGPALPQVRAALDTGAFPTAADASLAHRATLDRMRESGLTNIRVLPGLGDEAFVSEQGDSVGVRVRRGRMYFTANLDREETPFAARAAVAEALVRKMLEKVAPLP